MDSIRFKELPSSLRWFHIVYIQIYVIDIYFLIQVLAEDMYSSFTTEKHRVRMAKKRSTDIKIYVFSCSFGYKALCCCIYVASLLQKRAFESKVMDITSVERFDITDVIASYSVFWIISTFEANASDFLKSLENFFFRIATIDVEESLIIIAHLSRMV